jgi:hypothetical protein
VANVRICLHTESATLNAYHSLNALSTTEEIHDLLAKSWLESPDLTLRIIWNMRSIHEGHSNKLGFYRAFGWLYKHHPRTALKNLKFLVEGLCERKIVHKLKITFSNNTKPSPPNDGTEPLNTSAAHTKLDDRVTEEIITKLPHGCFKDLLNILVLALRDELMDPHLQEFTSLNVPPNERLERSLEEFKSIKKAKATQNERFGVSQAMAIRKAKSLESNVIRSLNAKKERQAKQDAEVTLMKQKLDSDKQFLALYASVAHIFADHLAKDAGTYLSAQQTSTSKFTNLRCPRPSQDY